MKTSSALKAMYKLEIFEEKHGHAMARRLEKFTRDRDKLIDEYMIGKDPNSTDVSKEEVIEVQKKLGRLNAAYHDEVGDEVWKDSKDFFKYVWDGWLNDEDK